MDLIKNTIQIPEHIQKQYNKLCSLTQNSENGNLDPKLVAEYCGKDYQWLLDATCANCVPFGFGTRLGKARGCFRFGVLPLFFYETQFLFRNDFNSAHPYHIQR